MSHAVKMLEALHNQEMELAEKEFHLALEKEKNEELFSLAIELQRLGFLSEAKQTFEKLLLDLNYQDEARIQLAEILVEDDLYDEAFALLDEIQENSEQYIARLLVEGDIYQILELSEVSLAKLHRAKELAPDESIIRLALAELLFSLGEYKKAAKEYATLDPIEIKELTSISIYERIGTAYSLLGRLEQALPFLEKALEEDRDNEELLYKIGLDAFLMKDYETSIRHLERLRAISEEFENYQLILAKALLEEERTNEAFEVLVESLRLNPYQAEVYQLASAISYQKGEVNQAEDYLLQAITLDDLRDENLYRLMNLYLEENRLQDVLRAFEEIEFQEHALANWTVAKTYRKLEEDEKAESYFETARLELLGDAEFLKDYALYLRDNGKLSRAEEFLQQAMEEFPEDIEIHQLADEIKEW
ncbi:Tetratricopeptide repeat-containing protein [Pilibacter termitis]|uniref:Tetratricopeptide repeat-containing protein n=1 Tax=Pilibacter termitis TaxID=263852 RepID=A0A1T4M6E6_9ENTE|nr:tetratricopeptide repeat protein [Pilibacter termitis]SJZ62471.1 Tetratricopeptide repeat-containing protein [Pilibacter termitis]